MKLLPALLFIVSISSCAGGWTDEDKRLFKKDCQESVGHQIDSMKRDIYCQCFTEEMVQTYPVFNDAMEHRDSAKLENAKTHCRNQIGMP